MNRPVTERILKLYSTTKGREPYADWFSELKDIKAQIRISNRLDKIEKGHFGDCKSVGGGIYELRFFFGPGYRVYFAKEENTIILLLCGGDKNSQNKDIETTKEYWKDHKERKNAGI